MSDLTELEIKLYNASIEYARQLQEEYPWKKLSVGLTSSSPFSSRKGILIRDHKNPLNGGSVEAMVVIVDGKFEFTAYSRGFEIYLRKVVPEIIE